MGGCCHHVTLPPNGLPKYAPTYPSRNMSLLCPACKTENASDATVCTHCAAALPPPPPISPRMSLLEQAMAKPAAMSFAKPVAAPVVPPPAAPVPAPPSVIAAKPTPTPAAVISSMPSPEPKSAPAPAAVAAKPAYTMPPLPQQPRPRRRSRAPWILAAVLFLALLGALVYEQLQIRGVSIPALLSSLFTARP